jgi:hypothetical protein
VRSRAPPFLSESHRFWSDNLRVVTIESPVFTSERRGDHRWIEGSPLNRLAFPTNSKELSCPDGSRFTFDGKGAGGGTFAEITRALNSPAGH